VSGITQMLDVRCSYTIISTSPSLYLQVLGTAAVSDMCTSVGPVLTDPIITLAPGELSTWQARFHSYTSQYGPGATWVIKDPIDLEIYGTIEPLDVKDLACPTWGLGRSTAPDGTVITTIGPPFLPLIIPPNQAFSLDPTWASMCTGINTDRWQTGSFVIFDPPQVLTPEPRMAAATSITSMPVMAHADPTTAPEVQATVFAVSAKSATPPTGPEAPPVQTGDAGGGSKGPSPKPSLDDQSPPASLVAGPVPPPTNESDPEVGTNSPSPPDPASTAIEAGDPLPDPVVLSSAHPDASEGGSLNPAPIQKATSQASPQPVDNSQPQAQGLGAIIYNAFGKPGAQTGGDTKFIPLPPSGVQEVTTMGNQVLSMDSSEIELDGSTYSAGGPAMTVLGSVLTLIPHPNNHDDVASDSSSNQVGKLPPALNALTIA